MQGAAKERVLRVDLSQNMLHRARAETHDPTVTYQQGDIEQLQLADASFDLVYSSLALHYVEAFDAVCGAIKRLLAPGGHFVFSIEHPIFTAPGNPGWQTASSLDVLAAAKNA